MRLSGLRKGTEEGRHEPVHSASTPAFQVRYRFMLTAIRNHAQSWFIKVLLGIIVLTFVISFGIGTFSGTKEVLVRLGNHEILVSDFTRQYQNALENLRQQYPDNADTIAEQTNLRPQVYNQMVNRYLMLKEARAQGFAVTKDELQNAIRAQSMFHVDGNFDFNTYRTILSRNDFTPESYEARMDSDLLLGKYERNLLSGVTVSKSEVEQRYRMENEEVTLDYVFVDPERFAPGVQVTSEEERVYYEENTARFMNPGQFRVRYLVLSLEHLLERVKLPKRATKRYYERHREEEFSTATRIRASHILKRIDPAAPDEDKQAIRAEMEEILAKARAGEDFAALAKAHSEDLTKDKGGDLGFFRQGDMVPAFEDAAFALDVGGISDIVSSPFGLHIVRVTAIEPGEQQAFESVQAQIVERLMEERAQHKLDLEAERLPQRIQRDGMEAVAANLAVDIRESGWFDGTGALDGLGPSLELYSQMLTLEVEDSGVWERNPVLGHVFYQVTDKREPMPRAFEEVQRKVRGLLLARKRIEAAATAAEEAFEELKAPGGLEAIAEGHGVPVLNATISASKNTVPGIGPNPDFFRTGFSLTEEAPYGLSTSQGKSYLVRLESRAIPERQDMESLKRQLHSRLKSEWDQYFLQKEYERLKSLVEIEVVAPEYIAGV